VLHHHKVGLEWSGEFVVETLEVQSDGVTETEQDARGDGLAFGTEEQEGSIALGSTRQLHEHAPVRSSQYSSLTLSGLLLSDLVPEAHDLSTLTIHKMGTLQNLPISLLEITLLIAILDSLEVLGNRLVLLRMKCEGRGVGVHPEEQ
jgi:hypothetical protein